MVKLVKGIMVGACVVCGLVAFGKVEEKLSTYQQLGEVIGYYEDLVDVKCENGEVFQFKGEEYEVGEKVKLSIRNWGDDLNASNDEVLKVEYLD